MSFAFKKFNFFQQHEVKLHGFPANSTCHCLGGSLLYVGCDNGTVHLLDEVFQSQGSLHAYGYKVLFMAWAPVSGTQLACCKVLAHCFTSAAIIDVVFIAVVSQPHGISSISSRIARYACAAVL
jgi:hypothetical protein